MSQELTASRGSASRTARTRPRSSPRSCSSSRASIRVRTSATRCSPAALCGRREAFEQRREHATRVADEPERVVARPDPPRVGVDVDEAPSQLEGVVARRLGAELGADGEDGVGRGEKLLDGGLVGADPTASG